MKKNISRLHAAAFLPISMCYFVCLLANRARFYRENKVEKVDLKSKQQVYEQLLVNYKRVGKVPILTPKAILYKIGKLFDEYIKQCKNKVKYSSHAAFLAMLNETFKVWPKNAVNRCGNYTLYQLFYK